MIPLSRQIAAVERECERRNDNVWRGIRAISPPERRAEMDADTADLTAALATLRRVEGVVEALRFYESEWVGDMEGDGETPGLSRVFQRPTDKLLDDGGRMAGTALFALPAEGAAP